MSPSSHLNRGPGPTLRGSKMNHPAPRSGPQDRSMEITISTLRYVYGVIVGTTELHKHDASERKGL